MTAPNAATAPARLCWRPLGVALLPVALLPAALLLLGAEGLERGKDARGLWEQSSSPEEAASPRAWGRAPEDQELPSLASGRGPIIKEPRLALGNPGREGTLRWARPQGYFTIYDTDYQTIPK